MSRWDQCCRNGSFNSNFAQRSGERSRRSEILAFRESISSQSETSIRSSTSTFNTDDYTEEVTDFCNEVYFNDMKLHTKLLKGIEGIGFHHPKKIQAEIFSNLSDRLYQNHVICAPNKSGKTSAVLLWILNELICNDTKKYPRALMMCPTNEVAEMTYLFAQKIANICEVKVFLARKGKSLNKCDKMTIDLIIGTPDKILKLDMNIQNAKFFVFDVAHYMSSSEGHFRTVTHIKSKLSSNCCYILCTESINEILNGFIDKYMMPNKSIKCEINIKKHSFKEVFVTYSNMEEKINALMCLEDFKLCQDQTVVFCITKDTLNRLKNYLEMKQLSFEILTGDLTLVQRKCVLEQFKENRFKVLITTYSFLKAVEACNIIKIINFEQILNEKSRLNLAKYEESKSPLNCKNCLVVNFVNQPWENFLLLEQPTQEESHYFANTRIIPANELINGVEKLCQIMQAHSSH
ncbi:ATP-dependent RNA helicase DDX19A [Nephila pilipes]|uniref:ATP-dependent RNA helicase DDX19A n=1 Tax=Nephila pilipes TaxID=299642 RepID=A0A8X6IHU9_NEPPI|nr:ATP-dependent RNA helicase DDX19A [Nephila pilipes]